MIVDTTSMKTDTTWQSRILVISLLSEMFKWLASARDKHYDYYCSNGRVNVRKKNAF